MLRWAHGAQLHANPEPFVDTPFPTGTNVYVEIVPARSPIAQSRRKEKIALASRTIGFLSQGRPQKNEKYAKKGREYLHSHLVLHRLRPTLRRPTGRRGTCFSHFAKAELES